MKNKFLVVLLVIITLSLLLISCNNDSDETNNFDSNTDSSSSSENSNNGEIDSSLEPIVFDITQFNGVSSEKLVSILGFPDNITETNERGFTSFPCRLYDYENYEYGFLRFDVINDKVTAITINGEIPYNNGKVLESLNVNLTNDDYISENDMYKKWEYPTDDIDLIHITLIDSNKNLYKSLSVEFDSRYYKEWNLPNFHGTISPGEYNILSKNFVKSLLISPNSANFPSFDWTYARNDYYFYAESYVDAENAFCSEIRHHFNIFFYNDTETIAYAVLDGETIINNGYIATTDLIKKAAGGDNTDSSSNPPTDDSTNSVENCVMYIENEIPITVHNGIDTVVINNIEYIFFADDRSENACIVGISFDLLSKEYVENFSLNFTLIGETTGITQEYTIDDINVYGLDGNYISITTDCYEGILPIDNYTIEFENVLEIEDDSNSSLDNIYLYVQEIKLENTTGKVLFSEVGGFYTEAENGMCNLSISFFGDKYQDEVFYLKYKLVGQSTGTVLEFGEYIYDYSDYHDGYYNFVFTIEHNDIPVDNYDIIFEDITDF